MGRYDQDQVRPNENSETMYKASGANVAVDCEAVTPHNTTELSPHARALYIGGTGNVTIVTPRDTTVLFTGVVVGTILPCYVKIVKATGTTATGIVAFYG
jgi:hypothetical protein